MQSNWSQEMYLHAWDFAAVAHHGQIYSGSRPSQAVAYITHIGSVAMELIWALGTDFSLNGNLAIQCALLHDTIEDTTCTYADIDAEFGSAVADGVLALTKDPTLPTKAARMRDSLERIKQQPREIWLVKLADRIINLSEPPFDWSPDKRSAYRQEAALIHAELHPANAALADRLAAKIETYQQYIAS